MNRLPRDKAQQRERDRIDFAAIDDPRQRVALDLETENGSAGDVYVWHRAMQATEWKDDER